MSLINERHWLLCTMNIVLECCVEVAMQASYFGQQTIFGVILHCNFNRSEEHTSELQSHSDLVCRLLLEKKKKKNIKKRKTSSKKTRSPRALEGMSRARGKRARNRGRSCAVWKQAGASIQPVRRPRPTA